MRIRNIFLSSLAVGCLSAPAYASGIVNNISVVHEESAPGPEAQMTLDQAVHSASSKLTALHPSNFSMSMTRIMNFGSPHPREKTTETRILAPFGFTQKSMYTSPDEAEKAGVDGQNKTEEVVSDDTGHKVAMSPIGKRWDTYALITGYGKGKIEGRIVSVVAEGEGTVLEYKSYPFTLQDGETFSKDIGGNPLFPEQGKFELVLKPHWN